MSLNLNNLSVAKRIYALVALLIGLLLLTPPCSVSGSKTIPWKA